MERIQPTKVIMYRASTCGPGGWKKKHTKENIVENSTSIIDIDNYNDDDDGGGIGDNCVDTVNVIVLITLKRETTTTEITTGTTTALTTTTIKLQLQQQWQQIIHGNNRYMSATITTTLLVWFYKQQNSVWFINSHVIYFIHRPKDEVQSRSWTVILNQFYYLSDYNLETKQ